MAKRKSPTPQELYQARKEREEQERTALLPPGLINHGNTCFMNSVLQGLIATRLLSDLAQFTPISPAVQRHSRIRLLSQRSPELTNAHSQAGEYEREWVDMMPIGDVFIDTMYKAWDNQKNLKRENMSPKSLLHAVGKKYDQYLDFAQQDAHEFLRILLDAMRMEEFDVIKARQPPPANAHKKRKRRRTELGVTPTTPQEEDDTKLVSFTDMIFAGRLTSVLVCQKCKHVSQTYEDFNDLSLSIKPDDAGKGHKRSRFKSFAKRLTAGTSNWNVASAAQRPSMWAKLGHFPNVEECLRAFTAVEVLDGENMVGCRRCWKIANGVYKQPKTGEEPQEGEDADDTDSAEGASPTAPDDAMRDLAETLRSQSSPVFTPLDEDGSMTSISSRAAASAPDSAVDLSEIEEQSLSRDKPLPSVPTISMTAAEGDEGDKRAPADGTYPGSPPPESRDSLTIPRRQQRPRPDADGASGDESDGSAHSSVYSGDTDDSIQPHPSNAAAKKKKPKPTVLRPAYKRYLIAAPPPVLVIHLKRFQQISKTSFVSFSSGFKKLEDYVAFPEWLDLKPYLAPTKEECAMGKKASAEHARKSEPCMYRLYAVVVHIGSMLGGHYIAYTALPPREGEPMQETEDGKKVPPKRQWAYISDTFVRLTTIEEVLKAKAYICMYERV